MRARALFTAYSVMPGCSRQAQGGGPSSANAHSPRCTRAAGGGLPPLVKMPRAHRLWFSLYRQSRPRITTGFTYDKRSVYFLMITAWRVDNFGLFFIHRVGTAISQVKAVLCVLPGSMIPSISPTRTQGMRCFAQVIHMVVHSRPRPVHDHLLDKSAAAGRHHGCLRVLSIQHSP